jgi:hypothetical protein
MRELRLHTWLYELNLHMWNLHLNTYVSSIYLVPVNPFPLFRCYLNSIYLDFFFLTISVYLGLVPIICEFLGLTISCAVGEIWILYLI